MYSCVYPSLLSASVLMHEIFVPFFLPALSRPSFTSRLISNWYSNFSTVHSFKSYNLQEDIYSKSFCACYLQVLRKKQPSANSGMFWFPWIDSHTSTTTVACPTLQYEDGTKFLIKRFWCNATLTIWKISLQPRVIFVYVYFKICTIFERLVEIPRRLFFMLLQVSRMAPSLSRRVVSLSDQFFKDKFRLNVSNGDIVIS